MSPNSLSCANSVVSRLMMTCEVHWRCSFCLRQKALDNNKQQWMKCSHVHGFHLIWPVSDALWSLHLNQLPQLLTAIREGPVSWVRRAQCLNAIPIHRQLQCLMSGGLRVPVLFVAAAKGQAGILKTKIPLCGGNWMKVCMHLCHQMKGSAPPTYPLLSSARDRTVDLPHLWSDWMEPFSIFLLKWQRDLLQGWVVTWHMTFCELILCCNRFIGQSVSGKDLLFRTSLQQEHRQQSLWLAGFGLWTRLQWRWLYCAANWDHSLDLLLKPSSSHSPSCGFCPLFWHSIHHSSLVPSSLPLSLTTKSQALCTPVPEAVSTVYPSPGPSW